tara:strand:- start:124493 stop:124987 length:495 start_codon:yes stop_codon:yes gene_type:complete
LKVLNIHKRTLNQPKSKVTKLLKTLSTENDRIWPKEKWPEMKFKDGIQVGTKGGHGPIRYTVEKYNPNEIIQFRFSSPKGFNGIHKFEILELDKERTEIKHTIDMHTTGKETLLWTFIIRSLHNALMEDSFDKLENNFSDKRKSTEWNMWVSFIKKQVAKKRRK